MPFSSGAHTRVYNWVTESGSPPIEISKLDTEFADVSTALNNCLLRDGTGLPVAAIPFNSQNITGVGALSAVSVTTSGAMTASGAVSGTTITGSSTVTGTALIPSSATVPANGMYLSAANTVALASNTTLRYSVNSTGNHVIAAPSSGNALVVNGVAANGVAAFNGSGAASFVTWQRTGTNVGDIGSADSIFGGGGAGDFAIGTRSTGSFVIATGSTPTARVTVATAGNVTVAAPDSGPAMTISAFSTTGVGLDVGNTINISGAASNAAISAGYGASIAIAANMAGSIHRLFIGDGSGWSFRIASRTGSVTTDRVTVADTGAVTVAAPTLGVGLTVSAVSGTHSTKIADSANTSYNAGFLEIPVNTQDTNYTCVLADSGKAIYHSDGTARTYTIPANASVAYPIGTTLTFVNDASAAVDVTISITTDTLALSPGGTTGSRTLARYGRATAHKVTATRWIISGTGLT